MSADGDVDGQVPPASAPPEGPPRGVRAMSIVRWVLVALAALVAAGAIASYARARWVAPKLAAAARLYRCPMHPAIVQDHPGQCPICGMTLVLDPEGGAAPAAARPEGAPADLTAVELTPERIQLVGMRTAPVTREAVGGEIRALGVVAASERGLAQIGVRFSGWVQKLLVSATGERVRRGEVLATIYSPDVLRAEQELLVAHGWSAGAGEAKPAHEHETEASLAGLDGNARRRLELLGISGAEIDGVLRAGKPEDAIAIRSPVDGTVVAKNAVAGVAVQPGTVLFEVADLSQVWVNAEIYERDVARIHVGQKARFEVPSLPGETHAGKVTFLYPVVDAASRTLRLRLELKNKSDRDGPRLKPGMTGTVHVDLPAATGLTVPAEAVVDTGEAQYLFVAKAAGRFEPRTVTVGARVGDRVEIRSGVREGETVVTTGNFLVDSESRLRAAIEGQKR